ncbi:MAG: hypothetical protein ABI430_00910 [Candidatus Taylorbacteria bacterium]
MKIKLCFDVRFLFKEKDHEKADREGYYERAFVGDLYYSFSRTISLPCLPLKGQTYQLRYDPVTDSPNAVGDNMHYRVRDSGFIEQDEKENIFPYFVISDDKSFSEWLDENPTQKNVGATNQYAEWESEVERGMVELTKTFKQHGWEQEL